MVHCPKCDADISDTFEPDDSSCGIVGGWYCDACDIGVAEWEVEHEPMEGDVPIMTAKEFRGDRRKIVKVGPTMDKFAADMWAWIERDLQDRGCFKGIDDDVMTELRSVQIETIKSYVASDPKTSQVFL